VAGKPGLVMLGLSVHHGGKVWVCDTGSGFVLLCLGLCCCVWVCVSVAGKSGFVMLGL